MKKITLIITGLVLLISIGLFFNSNSTTEVKDDIAQLKAQHISFLENNPDKEDMKLSRAERKLKGLPPNQYNERERMLTMDPSSGRPHAERLLELQETLNSQLNRVPGEAMNDWVERGPDNIGGRTRAIMFDPNDATNKRVFAGGVSGGLWVNQDITALASPWSEVGIPKNLSVSCITYDPNNKNIFYVGTGEVYVQGEGAGNGIWQSTDGGLSWFNIFGGVTGASAPFEPSLATVNSPASIAGDYDFALPSFGDDLILVTGDLVLADDSTAAPTQACNALTNGGAISGNIAVIERGECEFGVKVLNAQNAGAVAVIVIDNVAGNLVSMSGGAVGDQVTIPSIFISQEDGQGIMAEMLNGTVSVTLDPGKRTVVPGIQHINDIVVRDIGGGNSEVYAAAGATFYRDASPGAQLGYSEYGFFKSTDVGASWSQLTVNTSQGDPYEVNDIDISVDNATIWMSTRDNAFGEGGGKVFSSTDGTTFTEKYIVTEGDRTQIAVSGSNIGTVYVLSYRGGTNAAPVFMTRTDDAFTTTTDLSLPNSIDGGIPDSDFTNTQGWYDLFLEVDPNDDTILYAGGIDLFRSANTGFSWEQISDGYTVTVRSDVHVDQHAMTFHPTDSNKALFGNDGGVYYASDLSIAASSGLAISPRNTNYNVLQFYWGGIGQDVNDEKMIAGAQDNNSLLLNNATPGINSGENVNGGDGAYAFIDKESEFMVVSSQNGNFNYLDYDTGGFVYSITGGAVGGQFITPATLDSAGNVLYIDGSNDTSVQVLKYNLGATSAISSPLSDALLDSGPTAFKTSPTGTLLFIGTFSGKLLKLQNPNGKPKVWSDISGPDFLGSISSIELGATNDEIYVTFYNYGVTNIFYTSDGGTTWENKENNFPDIPVRAIMANPLNVNEVIIGTDLGVWGTPNFNDASPVWSQVQNGMKDVKVSNFDLRTADNTVLATTYGRGMFTGQFTNEATTLSVDQFSVNNLINVYPTVSNGNIMISPNSEVREGNLSVFDINGRNVHSSEVNFDNSLEQPIRLNVSSGMYIVKFTSNELQSTHKIIIE
jgi:hypothetical protein